MKRIFLIALIIFVSCKEKSTIQTEYGQLKIHSSYCKYDNDIRKTSSNFKLFKDGVLIKEVEKAYENEIIIQNLEVGSYILEYKTIYNYKNRIEINLSKGENKIISLCVDFLDYESDKNVLLIDELKNEESLIIHFQSIQCFGGSEKELAIFKTDDKYVVKFEGFEHNLTNTQLKLIKEFEIELRSFHPNNCSSMDNYKLVNVNSKQFQSFKDGSCVWRGFENLIDLLELTND